MACYYPRICYEDPKTRTKPFRVPCGNCIGCRLEYSRMWMVRCMHEASMWDRNCFITLTFDDDNLPKDLSVNPRHLQLFMKRLRKKFGKGIRFYGCGEYGSNPNYEYGPGLHGRPHYHALLFNHDFSDKKVFEYGEIKEYHGRVKPKRGEFTLYRSQKLENIWREGFSTIGEVTAESAGYVARYCTKKITGERPITIDGKRYESASDYYGKKRPEFALMSRRPGIGQPWIKKYLSDVYPKDFFTINGIKLKPFRYYDSVYMRERADNNEKFKTWSSWEKLKERRKEKAKEYETTTRLRQMEKYRKDITRQLQRHMEEV